MDANRRGEIELTNNKNSNVNNLSDPTAHNSQLLGKPHLSSLPLQILIFLSYHYSPLFFIVNICLFTYKAVSFYYPGEFLGWELTTVFLFIIIELVRLNLLSKGNKISRISAFGGGLLLTAPTIVLHVYYVVSQTYVLRVDVVMNSIGLVLVGLQIIAACSVMLNIYLTARRL